MSMGGADETPAVAEFNYWFDPVSVDIVHQAGRICPDYNGWFRRRDRPSWMNDLEFIRQQVVN